MTYKTPEGRAWVRIAQRFDAGKEGFGLCYATYSARCKKVARGTETDDVIRLFRPDDWACYYWPRLYEQPIQTERVYAALFIAAMCETGDAYPKRRNAK